MGHLDLLRELFGLRLIVTIDEAAPLLGWHPQSIRNAIAQGRWQIRVVRLGGRQGMTVVDLAAHLDGDPSPSAPTPKAAPRTPRQQRRKPATPPVQQKRGAGRLKKYPGLGV